MKRYRSPMTTNFGKNRLAQMLELIIQDIPSTATVNTGFYILRCFVTLFKAQYSTLQPIKQYPDNTTN
jgi:hypothetical protein